jgi:hypothetical protein
MTPHPDPGTEALEGTNAAYATHAEGQRAAREEKHKADLEAQENSGLVSVEGGLTDEAKFVGNPDDLRKDVDSEEKFSEGLENNPVDVEVGGETVTDPAEAKPEKESSSAPPPTKGASDSGAAKKAAAGKATAKK